MATLSSRATGKFETLLEALAILRLLKPPDTVLKGREDWRILTEWSILLSRPVGVKKAGACCIKD